MLTTKSADSITIFMQELFYSFSRVALKKNVPSNKRNKGTPDLESSFVLDSNYVINILSVSFESN